MVAFCPSVVFLAAIYFPIYIVIHMTQFTLRYDMRNKQEFTFNMMVIGLLSLNGGAFFTLIQLKELQRYFDNRATLKKEQ